MWNDPIVAETRNIRDEMAAQFNYDIWQLGEYFKSKRAVDAVALIEAISKGKSAVKPKVGVEATQTSEKGS